MLQKKITFVVIFLFTWKSTFNMNPDLMLTKIFFLFMLFLVFKYVIHSNLGKNVFEDVSFFMQRNETYLIA